MLLQQIDEEAAMINISVPNDRQGQGEGGGGNEKHLDFKWDIQRRRNVKAEIIPLVIGTLGNIPSDFESYLNKLPENHRLALLLTAALFQSAVLSVKNNNWGIPESWHNSTTKMNI